MNILVNGDSYSALDKHNNAYSQHLLGNITNIAERGCSNDRIFRSTIEYCIHTKPDFVIIGWSFIHRQEVVDAHNRFITLDFVLNEKKVADHYKMLADYDWNYKKLMLDFYTQVYTLSSWLALQNIKYSFFSAADNSINTINYHPDLLEYNIVKSVLNDKHIQDLHSWSIKGWSEKYNVNTTPTGHLLFPGQKLFAEYINDNFIH
jgi:hypothetical protein